MLRFYFEVARTAFRRQLIYRWANLAGLLTNVFFAILFSYFILALYHARRITGGYDVQDALSYTWLVQAMIMFVLPFGWYDLMNTIRSGEVVADLSKPCDFYGYWLSRELGRDCYFVLFRAIPTYVIGMLLFGLYVPGAWHVWLLYLLIIPIGALLGIAYRFLYNIVAFWIIEARAVAVLAGTIALFFTGSYLPLAFFPPWLHLLADWLPFNGLLNVPAEVFLGKLQGSALALEAVRQLGWLVVLTLFARWLSAVAVKRVIVQGG